MAAATVLIVALALPSAAQTPQGVKVGTLTCRLAPSIGLLIGSQQRMSCVFQPDGGYPHVILNSLDVDKGIALLDAERLGDFADYLAAGVELLVRAGADVGFIAANSASLVLCLAITSRRVLIACGGDMLTRCRRMLLAAARDFSSAFGDLPRIP